MRRLLCRSPLRHGTCSLRLPAGRPAATDDQRSGGVGLWAGVASIVLGLIYLAVAKGLSNGNNGSLLIVAIVSVLSVAAGLWIGITQTGNRALSGWSSVFWGVVILAILYSPRAGAFFRSR